MPKRWEVYKANFWYKIESNFTQNKYNKLQKISAKNLWFFANISANMGPASTVQLHGVDLIDIQIQNWL